MTDLSRPPFDAALFDLDGTVVDTEQVLYRGWAALVARAGADFSTFDYSLIIGKPDLVCCQIVSDHFRLGKDAAPWFQEYKQITYEMMDRDLSLRPGAHAVLTTFGLHRVPTALVTSAVREHAEKALGKFALAGLFRAMVTADTPGLAARKPDPAPYLMAASLLGVDPKRCIAFEDSPTGVRSARAAGCFVFGTPHEHSPAAHLGEAHVVLGSLWDFRPDLVKFP